MKRLVVMALLLSVGSASSALAGESLLTSGSRHVQQMESTTSVESTSNPAGAVVPVGQKSTPSFQGAGGTLSKSGMSKGKKALIYIGLAAAAVGGIMTIDKNVLDVTPSSLGTRKD